MERAVKTLLDSLSRLDLSEDIPERRARLKAELHQWDVPQVDVGKEADEIAEYESVNVPVRVYFPPDFESAVSCPTIVAYHGGAWVVGDVDMYANHCRFLCRYGNAVIVSVDYRLAPEHQFPVAVEDAYRALAWSAANIERLGADPVSLYVMGESAGGNLAAAVSILARDRSGPQVAKQLLLYPTLAVSLPDSTYQSRMTYGETEDYGLSNAVMSECLQMYAPDGAHDDDFRLSPILVDDCAGLPSALVVVAEYDSLRDEAIHFADRLRASEVHVKVLDYAGVGHAFMSQSGKVGVGIEALNDVAALIRQRGSWDLG